MKKNATRAALAATLIGLALPLHAEEFIDKRPYISTMFTYTLAKNDRNSDDGLGWYYSGGKTLNRFWNVELGTFYSRFNDESSTPGARWREYGAKVSGQYFYSREKTFSPYFQIGAGVQRTELLGTGKHDTLPMFDAGLGFLSWFEAFNHDVAFRAEADYRYAVLNKLEKTAGTPTASAPSPQPGIKKLDEPIFKVGFLVPFGAKTVVASTAPVVAATQGAARVLDSDGDGVADSLDRCPGTARGAVVDSTGCPREVTPAAAAVVCERQFDDVLFEFDRSEITANGASILDKAADAINPGDSRCLRVNIAGHTDSVGSEGYNQALSERRANAVRNYLVKKGVDASRIHTFAYGETTPKVDNESAEGRALNRRAEVKTAE